MYFQKTYSYQGRLSLFIYTNVDEEIAKLTSLSGKDFYLNAFNTLVFGIKQNDQGGLDIFIEWCYTNRGYSNTYQLRNVITPNELVLFIDKMAYFGIKISPMVLEDYQQCFLSIPEIGLNRKLYETARNRTDEFVPDIENRYLIADLSTEIANLRIERQFYRSSIYSYLTEVEIEKWITYFSKIQQKKLFNNPNHLPAFELFLSELKSVEPNSATHTQLKSLPFEFVSYKLAVSDFDLVLNNRKIKNIEMMHLHNNNYVVVIDYLEVAKQRKYFYTFDDQKIDPKNVINLFVWLGCHYDRSLRRYASERISPDRFDNLEEYKTSSFSNEIIEHYRLIHDELWRQCERKLILASIQNIKEIVLIFLACGIGDEIQVFIEGISRNPNLWDMKFAIHGFDIGPKNCEFAKARFANFDYIKIHEQDLSKITKEILDEKIKKTPEELVICIVSGFGSRLVNKNGIEVLKMAQVIGTEAHISIWQGRTEPLLSRHQLKQMGFITTQSPFYYKGNYYPTYILEKREYSKGGLKVKPNGYLDISWNIQVLSILRQLAMENRNVSTINLAMTYIPIHDHQGFLFYLKKIGIQRIEIIGTESWYKLVKDKLYAIHNLKITFVPASDYYEKSTSESKYSPYFYRSIAAISSTEPRAPVEHSPQIPAKSLKL